MPDHTTEAPPPDDIPVPDMPADGAARYRAMVREARQLRAQMAALAAENARLRAALGLWQPGAAETRTHG
jgi:hypothetical protein